MYSVDELMSRRNDSIATEYGSVAAVSVLGASTQFRFSGQCRVGLQSFLQRFHVAEDAFCFLPAGEPHPQTVKQTQRVKCIRLRLLDLPGQQAQ